MEHLSKEALRKYLSFRLEEEMLMEIEEHLAECAECSSKVRKAKLLQFAWENLTAKAHGQAYWQGQLESALDKVATSVDYANYRERIKEWIESCQNKAEAALGLVLETAAEQAQVITQGLEALVRPDSKLGFAFAKTPIRGTKEGSIIVEAVGPPFVNVSVDTKKRTVTVLLRKIEVGRKPPLVILVPDSKNKKPLLVEPKQPAGSKQFIAQFSNIPSGRYLLVFEPMKGKSQGQ